jgi:hypothetical protein
MILARFGLIHVLCCGEDTCTGQEGQVNTEPAALFNYCLVFVVRVARLN